MAELQAEFNQQLGVHEPEKIQMAVRVGRAEGAYVAPRRDPADFITDSTTGSDARPSSTAHPGKTPDRRLGRRRRVRDPCPNKSSGDLATPALRATRSTAPPCPCIICLTRSR